MPETCSVNAVCNNQNYALMKTQTFTVTLTFSDDIKWSQAKQITENIADSLKHTVDTSGICPDDVDYFTEKIEVTNNDLLNNFKVVIDLLKL